MPRILAFALVALLAAWVAILWILGRAAVPDRGWSPHASTALASTPAAGVPKETRLPPASPAGSATGREVGEPAGEEGALDHTIEGTVLDRYGTPVAGALIAAQLASCGPLPDLRREAASDLNGAFTVEGLAAGVHVLRIRRPGFATHVLADVEADTAIAVVLARPGAISGRVAGASSGAAALPLELWWRPRDGPGAGQKHRTEPDGSFGLDSLAPGVYVLEAVGRDGARAEAVVEVEDDRVTEGVELVLEPNGGSGS